MVANSQCIAKTNGDIKGCVLAFNATDYFQLPASLRSKNIDIPFCRSRDFDSRR